jgi:hypothetical protein
MVVQPRGEVASILIGAPAPAPAPAPGIWARMSSGMGPDRVRSVLTVVELILGRGSSAVNGTVQVRESVGVTAERGRPSGVSGERRRSSLGRVDVKPSRNWAVTVLAGNATNPRPAVKMERVGFLAAVARQGHTVGVTSMHALAPTPHGVATAKTANHEYGHDKHPTG